MTRARGLLWAISGAAAAGSAAAQATLFEAVSRPLFGTKTVGAIYGAAQPLIDLLVLGLFFIGISSYAFTRIWGTDRPVKAVAVAVGIALTIGSLLFLEARGLSIASFGPLAFLLIVVVLFAVSYKLLQDVVEEKRYAFMLSFVIAYILAMLIPNFNETLAGLGAIRPELGLINALLTLGFIVALIWLAIAFISGIVRPWPRAPVPPGAPEDIVREERRLHRPAQRLGRKLGRLREQHRGTQETLANISTQLGTFTDRVAALERSIDELKRAAEAGNQARAAESARVAEELAKEGEQLLSQLSKAEAKKEKEVRGGSKLEQAAESDLKQEQDAVREAEERLRARLKALPPDAPVRHIVHDVIEKLALYSRLGAEQLEKIRALRHHDEEIARASEQERLILNEAREELQQLDIQLGYIRKLAATPGAKIDEAVENLSATYGRFKAKYSSYASLQAAIAALDRKVDGLLEEIQTRVAGKVMAEQTIEGLAKPELGAAVIERGRKAVPMEDTKAVLNALALFVGERLSALQKLARSRAKPKEKLGPAGKLLREIDRILPDLRSRARTTASTAETIKDEPGMAGRIKALMDFADVFGSNAANAITAAFNEIGKKNYPAQQIDALLKSFKKESAALAAGLS